MAYGKKRTYAGKKRGSAAKKQAVVKTIRSKALTTRGPSGSALPVSLMYSDTYTLNPGIAGVGATQQFRLGGLHDPDYTGVGHQPNGYDQLYGLYERYQVWKVDFEIEFVSIDSSNPQGVGYRFNDEDLTSTDPRVNIEGGLGEFAVLGISGGNDRKTFRGSVKNCDIHGVTYKEYMSETSFGANFGSNPGSDAYLYLHADGLGTDSSGVIARVRLTYHAKLEGSKLLALS